MRFETKTLTTLVAGVSLMLVCGLCVAVRIAKSIPDNSRAPSGTVLLSAVSVAMVPYVTLAPAEVAIGNSAPRNVPLARALAQRILPNARDHFPQGWDPDPVAIAAWRARMECLLHVTLWTTGLTLFAIPFACLFARFALQRTRR